MRIASQTANIHIIASSESETTSQGLFGERVKILKEESHWSYVQLLSDGYTGYMENHHLISALSTNTHRVIHRSTPLFTRPDIKSAVHTLLNLASELSLKECAEQDFFRTDTGLFIWKQHVLSLNNIVGGQMVGTAQSLFLGAPYLWGGRSPMGLDCSALVQISALLHGFALPRDTQDQVAHFQQIHRHGLVEQIEYSQRQVDDLVYWPGHVALVLDKQTVIHATAHSLSCCHEALHDVETRAGAPTELWRVNLPNNPA